MAGRPARAKRIAASDLPIHEGLKHLTTPAIRKYVEELYAEYGQSAVSPEETRRIVDRAMGETTLTEVLYEMRRDA